MNWYKILLKVFALGLNKLFEYTDKEIRTLVMENKELKKRLGIKEEEEIFPSK